MKHLKIFIGFGFVFHILWLSAIILDIYFKSSFLIPVNKEIEKGNKVEIGSFKNESVIYNYTQLATWPIDPLAKRVVLIIADGLKADKFFELTNASRPNEEILSSRTPFLRHIIRSKGSFGLSKLSRFSNIKSSHASILNGLYQKNGFLSFLHMALTLNPLALDNIINHSNYFIAFGNEQTEFILDKNILKIDDLSKFNLMTLQHMNDTTESLSSLPAKAANGSVTNLQIFNMTANFFKSSSSASSNPSLHSFIKKEEQVIIYVHLPGLNMINNQSGSKSSINDYLDELGDIDGNVKHLVNQISEFFENDEKTLFIFTGTRADKNNQNAAPPSPYRLHEYIRVKSKTEEFYNVDDLMPLIIWGPGIQGPSLTEIGKGHDEFSSNWGLHHFERKDIHLNDFISLISLLTGMKLPLSSMGSLPINYLKLTEYEKSKCLHMNAEQIFFLYESLERERIKKMNHFFFKPYSFLNETVSTTVDPLRILVNIKDECIEKGKYEEGNIHYLNFISQCSEGLHYLYTYDWIFLKTLFILGYLGWILFCFVFILKTTNFEGEKAYLSEKEKEFSHPDSARKSMVNFTCSWDFYFPKTRRMIWMMFILLAFIVTNMSVYILGLSIRVYVFMLFCTFFWSIVFSQIKLFQLVPLVFVFSKDDDHWLYNLIKYIIAFSGLGLLISSYFYQETLCCFFLVLSLWPIIFPLPIKMSLDQTRIGYLWTILCVLLSLFPISPQRIWISYRFLFLNLGLLWLSICVFLIPLIRCFNFSSPTLNFLRSFPSRNVYFFMIVCLLAGIVKNYSVVRCDEGLELPILMRLFNWCILLCSLTFPFYFSISRYNRPGLNEYMQFILSLSCSTILLSTDSEVLFFGLFSMTLFLWIYIEHDLLWLDQSKFVPNTQQFFSWMVWKHLKIALCFLFFIHYAYFGSFSITSWILFLPESLKTLFLDRCDDYVYFNYLIWVSRIWNPLLFVSGLFSIACQILSLSGELLLLIMMNLSGLISLVFFIFMDRTFRSWEEMQSGIAHLFFVNLLIFLECIIYFVSKWLFRNAPFLKSSITCERYY